MNKLACIFVHLSVAHTKNGKLTEKEIRHITNDEEVLSKFNIDDDGLYYNKRLLEEITFRQLKTEKNRENGSKGGNPNFKKGKPNPYYNQKEEDILENAKPVLAKYCTVLTVSDRIILIGERYYIEATATLHDVYSDAQIENVALAREEETKKGMDGSQITGTASSYARKIRLKWFIRIR